MRINTNTNALNTLRNLQQSEQAVASSAAKLSSGFRINRAADDAAGLAIANKLRNTGRALGAASRNAQQASAMLQIADGAAMSLSTIVDRMKELAQQGASDNIGSQGQKLQDEFKALNDEIDRIVSTTQYQGTKLLAGAGGGGVTLDDAASDLKGGDISKVIVNGAAGGKTFTIKSDKDADGVVTLDDGSATGKEKVLAKDGAQTLVFSKLGITIETGAGFKIGNGTDDASFDGKKIVTKAGSGGGGLDFVVDATGDPSGNDKITVSLSGITSVGGDISTKGGAIAALTSIDNLQNDISKFLGNLGAAESRLDFAQKNLASTIQNTAAAESAIRDVDMAEEMTNFSKSQILAQAGTAMLAQANASGQNVLQLLRG